MVTERKTAPGRLSFNEFMEAFRAQYKYGASQPLKKYSITEQIIHKNNRNLHGIIVRAPGNRIAPVFYYSRHQSSADNFCRRIIPFYGFEHDIIGILKAKRVQAGNRQCIKRYVY